MAQTPSNTATTSRAESCAITAPDGSAHWDPTYADAWLGMLQTHRQLTHELDARLEAASGLTLSGLELLGRLSAAPERWLRLSMLASQTGLSLSRVSRIVDALEGRGLIERRSCPADARATNAHLTPAGAELLGQAEGVHIAVVQERFFDRLSAEEVQTLAVVFARFAPGTASACTEQATPISS
jgi:DNA-binding MarR family transcriptional regulator